MTSFDLIRHAVATIQTIHGRAFLDDPTYWHIFLYEANRDQDLYALQCIRDLQFEWDGPIPECIQLKRFINSVKLIERGINLSDETAWRWATSKPASDDLAQQFIISFIESCVTYWDTLIHMKEI